MSTKQTSALATAVLAVLTVVLMLLVSGYRYVPPIPPPPEEGVEVNLGDTDFGSGHNEEPASSPSSYAPPAASEQVVTQRAPSVPVKSSPNPGNVTNPAAEQKPTVENKEPEINKNALFPGKRNQQRNGGNEGNTQGQGNQGKPDGNPNSDNYSGNGGGNGVSFSLKGRSAVALPNPKTYRGNDQGKVVVKVWVDQQGNVIRTEAPQKGSTLTKQQYVSMAVEYAKKAKFSPSKDAPEEQVGTITYIFKI